MSILLTCNPSKSKRCYCALICFGHFWPPNLCLIPDLYAEFPALYSNICVSSSTAPTMYVFGTPNFVSIRWPMIVLALYVMQMGRARSRRWQHFCAGERTELFWLMIYCANPRPNPGSQSGSRSLRGLGRRAPQNMGENNLTTAIATLPLTQPCTCRMGSLIFSAMS